MQAWHVLEINGNSAGEHGKLGTGIFVILPSTPWRICQKFLNYRSKHCSEFCELLRSLPQTFFLKHFQPDNDLLRHPPTSGPPMPQWDIMQWLCAWTLFLRLKFQIRNIKDIQLTWQARIIVQICHFLLLHNFNLKLAHLMRKVVILNLNIEIRISIITHL